MSYNVLTNLFARDPTKDFPFDIIDKGERSSSPKDDLFTLGKARKKGSQEINSIFICDLKTPGTSLDDLAKAKLCAKRIRTLKHPSLLTFVDSCETDSLVYIVTEEIVSLPTYLESVLKNHSSFNDWVAWGLYQIVTGLKFLNQDAKLIHDNLRRETIFVNNAGDWKIFGLEYTRPNDQLKPDYPKPTTLQIYSIPEDRWKNVKRLPWCVDGWALACLIWQLFNGPLPDDRSSNTLCTLKAPKSIPKSLRNAYVELLKSNCCKPEKFLELGREEFFKNDIVDFLLCLDQFQLKDQTEKSKLFAKLNDQQFSAVFPEQICKFKILPQLITMFEFGDAGPKIITPMLRIGRGLNESEYQNQITPTLVKLFASPDRATRVKLLKEMDVFIGYIQSNVINEKIFQHFVNGFMDSNPAVREATLKAVVNMASKLNYQNLNVELMKHLARLQSKDDQPAIRTNATVCLGKIGQFLDASVRQKILIAAFCRALHDPFPPARVASILALTATQQFYTAPEIALKVLPALCPATFDPDQQVRQPAFRALRGFLDIMERVSNDPELAGQMERDARKTVTIASSNSGATQWASWAISALSSKFYKGSVATTATTIASSPDPQTSLSSLKINTPADKDIVADEKLENLSGSPEIVDSWPVDDEWNANKDDDEPWQDFDVEPKINVAVKNEAKTTSCKKADGWDLDDWTG